MAPQEYSWEVREKAAELYIVDGLTFEQLAEAIKSIFGDAQAVSISQLKRWSAPEAPGGDWVEKKKELREALGETKRNKILLLKKLSAAALDKMDPQIIYAFLRTEKQTALSAGDKKEEKAPDLDRPALFLEDLNFIATILKEIDPEGLKIMSRNFDAIVSRFKADHAKTA
jgi:hypothetical protein